MANDVNDNWFIDLNITILLCCLKAHFCPRNKSYKVSTLGFMSVGIVVDGASSKLSQHELIKLKYYYYYRIFAFLSVGRRKTDSELRMRALRHWPNRNRSECGRDMCRVSCVCAVCALYYSCIKINYRLLAFMLLYVLCVFAMNVVGRQTSCKTNHQRRNELEQKKYTSHSSSSSSENSIYIL